MQVLQAFDSSISQHHTRFILPGIVVQPSTTLVPEFVANTAASSIAGPTQSYPREPKIILGLFKKKTLITEGLEIRRQGMS